MNSKKYKSLYFLFLGLVLFGLIILASASSVVGFTNFGDNYYYFKHQLLFGLLPGLILFFITIRIPYKFWQKNASWLFGATLLLLLLVFIPGVGQEHNKAQSWINLGISTLQPSEIAKLALIIYLAAWLAKNKGGSKSFSNGLLPFLIITGIIAGLIALQPDIGTLIIILIIALSIYFVAGLRWKHLAVILALGGGIFGLLIIAAPYRINRILTFLDPSRDTQGIGYHINQALLAVGSGGWLGLGIGKSRQKFEFLPEVSGDSIFAILAEELGFILATIFILTLIYFVIRILRVAKNSNDDFARFFAAGLAAWIGGQALINIGAMLGLLPLTGVPLPFISYGGTALMILMAASGILINIAKES